TDIVSLDQNWSEPDILGTAASAEQLSEHHLSQAIVRAATDRGFTLKEPRSFRAFPGKGVIANVDDHEVAVGNEALFCDFGVELGEAADTADRLRRAGKSAVYFGDRSAI